MTEDTIIPRPETEYMIEVVREYCTSLSVEKNEEASQDTNYDHYTQYVLVDVGTGSGVLGLSLVHSHVAQFEQVFLIDISEKALDVARLNYESLVADNKIQAESNVCLEQ